MPLLKALTRDEVAPELRALWDECQAAYPDFRNSWATMAHSPILFRHVWGQLLALKKESPVEARHFELAIAELVWRTTQGAAFNWHNELLELDLEPEVRPWIPS